MSNVEDILHFAEFGVVLMLFLVGLELEPRRLWSLRRPIFGWGSAQVLACTGALAGVAVALGVAWPTAVVAALGLALSSTAIALQVMQERNLLRTSSGQSGFSILLFQDVAAIPILALLPLLGGLVAGTSGSGHAAPGANVWLQAITVIGIVGGVILGGRLLLRPALRWIAKSKTSEVFTAAALLLVVGIAMLMQWLGLSMALGAFLAGVLLADSEYRRELETDIEPFKGLLLGLFFIAVGMSIDFGVLMRPPGRHGRDPAGLHGGQAGGDLCAGARHEAAVPGAPGVHAAAGARRRVRLRGVPGGRRRQGVFARSRVAADRRGRAVDAAQPALAAGRGPPAAAALRELQCAGARRDLGAAGRAHHHCRLRPLRPDHWPHAVGAGHPGHRAGP